MAGVRRSDSFPWLNHRLLEVRGSKKQKKKKIREREREREREKVSAAGSSRRLQNITIPPRQSAAASASAWPEVHYGKILTGANDSNQRIDSDD